MKYIIDCQYCSVAWVTEISPGCSKKHILKKGILLSHKLHHVHDIQRVNYTAEHLLHLLISRECCNFLDLWIAGVSQHLVHNSSCLDVSLTCWAETISRSMETLEPWSPLSHLLCNLGSWAKHNSSSFFFFFCNWASLNKNYGALLANNRAWNHYIAIPYSKSWSIFFHYRFVC